LTSKETITKTVKKLIKKYGTNDPFELAKYLDIIVIKCPMVQTNGFYQYFKRNKIIYINDSIDEYAQITTCAHELGHALHHTKLNAVFINSNTNFVSEKFENEANLFAAELLLADICEENCYELTLEQVAATYNIDKKFVELKFRNEFG
jgi:Zn-dependent peptidase ImmA (M78 family)